MPQDIELEDDVKAALAGDPRVDHDQAIAVFASAGVVSSTRATPRSRTWRSSKASAASPTRSRS
jgi:hypothetical protein